ncbi:MAG: hypothetical protein IKF80_09175, partial [Erysipelotrichaceae bacterium]|nr:hypothetical protein [Erysipelotrichaceae bacterium]
KALEQEPCEDAVSRQAVIDDLKQQAEEMSHWSERYVEQRKGILTAINIVSDLPSVTPQQKTGRWIKQTLPVKPFGEDTVLCDQCGFMTAKDVETNYCPNCGAKMIKSQESEE